MFFNQINQCSIREAFTKHFYLQFLGSNMYALVRSISVACLAGIEQGWEKANYGCEEGERRG